MWSLSVVYVCVLSHNICKQVFYSYAVGFIVIIIIIVHSTQIDCDVHSFVSPFDEFQTISIKSASSSASSIDMRFYSGASARVAIFVSSCCGHIYKVLLKCTLFKCNGFCCALLHCEICIVHVQK